MSLKFYSLKKEYKKHLTKMLDEWIYYHNKKVNKNEFDILAPSKIFNESYSDFDKYLEYLRPRSDIYGKVPSSTYFLYDDEYDIFIGVVDIRHYLNDFLKQYGGHIGIGIRPSMRNRGYGTKIIALAIPLCKQLGISKVLITCDERNIASEKAIIKNGGIFDGCVDFNGTIIKRYYINLTDINVKLYKNKDEFIINYNDSYKSLLNINNNFIPYNICKYVSNIDHLSKNSYIIKLSYNNEFIIAIKPKDKDLLLLGSLKLAKYLVNYLLENNYYFSNFLGANDLTQDFKRNLTKIGIRETESHIYDIYSRKPINKDYKLDIMPKISDIDNLLDIIIDYDRENKLYLNIDKNDIINNLNQYRILRKDNKIIAYIKFEEEKDYLLIKEIYSAKKYRDDKEFINDFIKQFLYEASKYNKIVYSFVYYLYVYIQFNYVCEYYYCNSTNNQIFGKRIVLRKAKDSDLDSIYNNVWKDETLASKMFWSVTTNITLAKARLKRTKHYHKNVEYAYFIALKDTDEAIGFVSIRKNNDNTFSEHGLCVSKKYQNQGIGTEVLSIILDFLFNILEIDAFYYSLCSGNNQSKALVNKFPFKFYKEETITRGYDNKVFNIEYYALTKEDYLNR